MTSNLNELVLEIKRLIDLDCPIIVEGQNDVKALENAGIPSENVFMLQGNPLFKIIESITADQVVILTDLDKEGKKLYGSLAQDFNRLGVKIENRFREYLFKNTELRQIEGMTKYLLRLSR